MALVKVTILIYQDAFALTLATFELAYVQKPSLVDENTMLID